MSLLLLIDGYNVVAPIAAPARGSQQHWLRRERAALLDRLVRHLDEATRQRTCVVFDAAHPPADRPHTFDHFGIAVRYAVGYPEADDLLEELIAGHSAPKQLMVVSSDQRLKVAASRRGASSFDSQPWLDDLLDGQPHLAATLAGGDQRPDPVSTEKPADQIPPADVRDWLEEFGFPPPEKS